MALRVGINGAIRSAVEGPLKGILRYCEEELVSVEFNGGPYSSIFDSALTKVMDNNFVKVLSRYDNERGSSNRMRDVALYLGKGL